MEAKAHDNLAAAELATQFVGYPVALAPTVSQAGQPIPLWKRALDLVCILLALPVILPVMLVISLLIKMVSPGPVFFRQERVGHHGRRFLCYKFRTMVNGSDPDAHRRHLERLMDSSRPMVKLDALGDQRLIPMGRVLRATGLDELPQLFNVLRGEMSLVGPRPCLPFEFERYLPWQRERFQAVPGLTGLWQVSGKNRTTFDEMIELDVAYCRNSSLRLDLQIMFKTFPALIAQTREMRVVTSEVCASPGGRAAERPPVDRVAV
jgi:lipopolysaccharide/colanic/teichoic acid biosynthesis glycosyltransferase